MRVIKFRAWDKERKKMCFVSQVHFIAKGLFVDADFSGFVGDRFEPLVQFTGLHDKNGKEIWEGDVCRRDFGNGEVHKGIVEWVDGGLWLVVDGCHTNLMTSPLEVLGNIYENPELLSPRKSSLKGEGK